MILCSLIIKGGTCKQCDGKKSCPTCKNDEDKKPNCPTCHSTGKCPHFERVAK